MSAATILFTDIVAFSKKPTAEQRRIVDGLNGELLSEVRLLLSPPMGSPRVIAWPTGDGAALVFVHDGSNPLDLDVLFNLILRLQQWAALSNKVCLRIGVHVGAVTFITDINGRTNICGDTINYAQRVMDACNPCQVLFSEAAFREYITDPEHSFENAPFPSDAVAKFDGPIEVFAKHGLRIPAYKLTLLQNSEPLSWWNNDDPKAKDWTTVSLTPLPKEIAGSFGDQLAKASRVAFIQLTGDRLLGKLDQKDEASVTFSKDLERLWVFMPDPEFYQRLAHSEAHPAPEFVKECMLRWKEKLVQFRHQLRGADVRLGLFKEPGFLGASFLNWDRPGGRIHVSPYVWNVPTLKCPGFDLEWLAKLPSPIYETYVKGLDYLQATTANALDD